MTRPEIATCKNRKHDWFKLCRMWFCRICLKVKKDKR